MTEAFTFAVVGAKGGVGKTTTSINVGATLASKGLSVLIVDVDLAMANLSDFLDIDCDPEEDPTLHDVLAGDCPAREAFYEAPGGITVLPSGTTLEGYARADTSLLGEVLDVVEPSFDAVFLDTGAGLSYETLLPVGLADAAMLVSTPRLASMRDAQKTAELAERADTPLAGVVFAFSGTGRTPDVDRLAGYLDTRLLGHVPEDPAVMTAQDVGEPIVVAKPSSPAGMAYRSIGDRLIDLMAERRGRTGTPRRRAIGR